MFSNEEPGTHGEEGNRHQPSLVKREIESPDLGIGTP